MRTLENRIYLPTKGNTWFIFSTEGDGMWHKAGLLQVSGIEVWLLPIV